MLDSAGGRSAYHMAAANRSVFPILEESVNADPSYELTSMKLLDVYEQLKLKSERNKLLDKMVKQFPDSDVVLLKAGSACLDRGVYVKGLAYLEKARAASPLNNEIAAKIRQGLVQKAVAHYKKGGEADVKKARATFEQIFVETGSLAVDGISLRAVYYLELSVLEDLALGKKGSRGDEIRAQFVDMEPQLMEYIESLYSSEYAPLFHKLFKGKALKAPYTPGLALQMFQFLESVYIPSRSLSLGENGIPLLHNYLERALKKLEVTDRDVLIRLYGTFEKSGYYWVTHTEGMVKRYLKLDKEDPLFTVWKWKNDICEPTKKQIAKVRAAAVSRGDVLASKALDAYVKFIEEEDDFDYDDTYGYDPFDIDDDDDDDGFGKIYEGLKNMSSSERIEAFMAQGSTRDEAKSICKVFDEMEELENSFSDDSPIKPKKKVAKKAKKKVTQKKTENESALDEGQGEFPF
jgi:tetratricopeptide (TPR) repeat protein